MKEPFKTDLVAIRKRAREHMADGAVTTANKKDVDRLVAVLNTVLATEIVCVLRYKNHYYMATGLDSAGVAAEFLQHAAEEQQHADWISARIVQLGGKPNLDPTRPGDARALRIFRRRDARGDVEGRSGRGARGGRNVHGDH